MIVLACETSTLLGSVAVLENDRVLALQESMRQGSHSDVLNVFVEQALAAAGKRLNEIDLFVSGIGPGSFTGIRISVNTVKSFAFCHNKPVVGINSLASLAYATKFQNIADEFKDLQIVSMINAYKNMCYVSTCKFEGSGFLQLKKPEVVRVQNLSSYITEKSIVCGDGFSTYQSFFPQTLQDKMVRIPQLKDEPHASTIGIMASLGLQQTQNWNELLPLYLRASEAEENLQGIKYQPLI